MARTPRRWWDEDPPLPPRWWLAPVLIGLVGGLAMVGLGWSDRAHPDGTVANWLRARNNTVPFQAALWTGAALIGAAIQDRYGWQRLWVGLIVSLAVAFTWIGVTQGV